MSAGATGSAAPTDGSGTSAASAADLAGEPAGELEGQARVGRRVGSVVDRLYPGDVAVVDHSDLDLPTARALLRTGVGAVVNAAPMMSGRVPSAGTELLAEAGVVLVDEVGRETTDLVGDDEPLRIRDGVLLVGGAEIGRGRVLDRAHVRAQLDLARTGLPAHLETFTGNAAAFLAREADLVLDGVGLPTLGTALEGRVVVVVARAGDHESELAAVRRFARDQDAVVIAVDKAADDVLEAGLSPDVVVVSSDDPAAVPSVEGLRATRDVVVRVEPGGRPRMLESLTSLGAEPVLCETTATAEDVALLLCVDGGADLVVGVGVNADLTELLGHRRAALASTHLTRLRLGPTLVDSSVLTRFYAGQTRWWHVVVVMLAGWIALGAAIATTPVGHDWFTGLVDSLQGLF